MPVVVEKSKRSAFGTEEWASCTFNNILGCPHDCLYCYSKAMAIRFKRSTSESWKDPVYTHNKYSKKKIYDGRVMYPSTHDIVPDFIEEALAAISDILATGNELLIVTKPHSECIEKICSTFYGEKEKILFRFTIGSIDNETLSFWEPGAPDISERLSSVRYAYRNGFSTSISMEPVLDDSAQDLIEDIYDFISGGIWIGEANFLFQRMRQNGVLSENNRKKAIELLNLYESPYFNNLYDLYKDDEKIFWKDSLKKRFGLKQYSESGLDK